ncbi:hypothetical protein CVT26_012926 [Gymnopilus dilepis]|uniref:Galactose oxidase-like Early set domain-containing protein n=1 Tax=Gymnopilus dilepis TaxID=231916 RepID=A0A409X3V5_9AGAR|nr:hypothetical protein CVT26_012926 [Gymnopilus dilepis]
MKFSLTAALFSLASLASATVLTRQNCPQASRFGDFGFTTPNNETTVNPGDTIHVIINFNCAINTFGIRPQYYDLTIQVPPEQNNGHEAPIVLTTRSLAEGATTDEFDVTIPHAFYFANAPYNVVLTDTYPTQGTDGSQVLLRGGVEAPISIAATS